MSTAAGYLNTMKESPMVVAAGTGTSCWVESESGAGKAPPGSPDLRLIVLSFSLSRVGKGAGVSGPGSFLGGETWPKDTQRFREFHGY